MRRLQLAAIALLVSGILTTHSRADFDLQVTEIWMGQTGTDITEDWFEVVNQGDMPWIAANDGALYYDDISADPLDAVQLLGIDEIGPGEIVVFVDEGETALADFLAVWEPVKGPITGGYYDGAGLGQGGDAVNIWLGDPNSGGTLIDTEDYPETNTTVVAASWDVNLDAFSTVGNANGAVETTVLGGDFATVPGVGSPGMLVPEPTSLAIPVAGMFALIGLLRRKLR